MIDSVPLIQNVAKDDINTSIIALKKEEKRLEQLIAEADAKIKELNELKVNVSDIVNEVTSGNMHSVSSNAVASELSNYAPLNKGVAFAEITPRTLNTPSLMTSWAKGFYDAGYKFVVFSVNWSEYQSFNYAGAIGFVMFGSSSGRGYGKFRHYSDANFTHSFYWTDTITVSRYSGIKNL